METEPPRSTSPRPHGEHLTEQESQTLKPWFLASSRPQTENLVTAKGCSTHTFYKQIQGARHPLKPNPHPVEIQTPKLLSFHTTTLPPTGEEGKGIAQYLKHIYFLSLQNLFISLPCYFINSLWILFYRARLWSEMTWAGVGGGLGASLVAQWLRICLPMQGTRVRALVWEDPTCHGATRPVSHNCWACTSGACAPQQERPR